MTDDIALLSGTAASLGVLHTLLGPDHYLPFVAMSRAGRWSMCKTVLVTLLCGLGHVLSSVALGAAGFVFGIGVLELEAVEGFRGNVAGWFLLAFGLVYFTWGIRRGIRNRPHSHSHVHTDGMMHAHEHLHHGGHLHVHEARHAQRAQAAPQGDHDKPASMTPWVLFSIFLFGPCEPLIPLLMYPAASGRGRDVVIVTVIFGAATLATMTAAVLLAHLALARMQSPTGGLFAGLERFSHALAGLVVALCGAGITAGL